MACYLAPSCSPSSTFASTNCTVWCSRRSPFRCSFSASTSDSGEVETEDCATKKCKSNGHARAVLVEKYNNGTSRRYYLDGESRIRTLLDEQLVLEADEPQFTHSSTLLNWLPITIKDFILPAGFPGSVSEDYLEYMLWQVPTNITGWVCHTLVTSSLLKAVGIGSFPGTAAAAAAAIRWVSKDGIGAVGRLIIGGRFGTIFDDDPKQWRMYADFIGSAGSIFDLSTPLYPAYFLPLASLGNLTKAVARGLKDPSFRVIQNHFAVSGNVGDVAAKEEVWEVIAQLLGLGLGVLILSTPVLVASYPVLVSTWLGMRLLHLWLRYQSLSALQFTTINLKRARALARSHVLHSTVPGCMECNREENILSWQRFLKPRIILGVPLEDMVASKGSLKVRELLKLYAKEKYILVVNHDERKKGDFEILVSLKKGATSLSALRVVWQSYWMYENWDSSKDLDGDDDIEQSLLELDERFDDFVQKLEGAGWDTCNITVRVPKEPYIEEL